MIAALAAAMIPLMVQSIPLWRPELSDAAVKRIVMLLLVSSFAVLIVDISYAPISAIPTAQPATR